LELDLLVGLLKEQQVLPLPHNNKLLKLLLKKLGLDR
jgi:hypothetical protein